MSLINQLNWRYATKRMNGQKVSQEKIDAILEAIRLSASSYGLQPYTIFAIQNEEVRKNLLPAAYNQPQIVEASHILIFAAWDKISQDQIDAFFTQIEEVRGATTESLAAYKAMIENTVNSQTGDTTFNWTARQAYIALGTGLIAAAEQEVDAAPLEGFDPAAVDEILGLKARNLRSVAILALGYRDASADQLGYAKKVRRDASKLFVTLD